MASFPVTSYGDWVVTKTFKEGEVVFGDGEKPRDGKLWVTVTKKDSASTAGMAATGGSDCEYIIRVRGECCE